MRYIVEASGKWVQIVPVSAGASGFTLPQAYRAACDAGKW